MRRSSFFFLTLIGLFFALAACHGGDEGGSSTGSGGGGAGVPVSTKTGTIVVGVTSDLRLDVDVDRVHIVMRAGGKVVADEVLSTPKAAPGGKLAFPVERYFADLPKGEDVSVAVDAFNPIDQTNPAVHRIASTQIVGGKTLLLRLMLDSRCQPLAGSMAPTCVEPQTCISGVCATSAINPASLPTYKPGWSKASTDVCKPGDGPPTVVVGEGQADYLPLTPNELVQVEAGPQGGHHVWIAIRLKNLHQSGSITAVTGHIDDVDVGGDGGALQGVDVGPFQVIFDFDPDEGGYCKLYGLRFQLDQQVDIKQLLGKVLHVTVTVTDKDGDVGVGTQVVKLSDSFI